MIEMRGGFSLVFRIRITPLPSSAASCAGMSSPEDGGQKCVPFVKKCVKNATPKAESRRPRGVRGGWGSKERTLRQKVRQKGVPLGKKSSFGMELSRPRGPPFPVE